MILLDKSNYHKVIKPLGEVTINKLFARAVVEQKEMGCVYVDNIENPQTFYVYHPYGMSLLFGEHSNDDFNDRFLDYALNIFKIRDKHEWLQAFPGSWNKTISELLGDKLVNFKDNTNRDINNKIEENTRVNFKFNAQKYLEFKSEINFADYKIFRTDKEMYENMEGSVVPKYFWNDANHFCRCGVGFSLIYENRAASTAYSAFIIDRYLEIGIETTENYRGKGFAIYTCSALIDYCLSNNLEPVWSCRLENTGSFNLAQKLGFEPTLYIPFYRLCK